MSETIIGSGVTVEGTITGNDRLLVTGTVKGEIDMNSVVTIDTDGEVDGPVAALEVVVMGTVNGSVSGSRKVDIRPNANVEGDVRTARILISEGAVFRGRVEMDLG